MNQPANTLPEKFLTRLNNIYKKEDQEKLLESFNFRKPSTFRANTLKISADELKSKLIEQNIEVEQITWYKNAFILKNVPQRVLTETELYKQGCFYVQSLSSMIPPLILDPKQEYKVLDLCAAPGSKTTQIAMIMENSGEIIANDKSYTRNFRLTANLKMQGITNSKVIQMPGEILWKKFPEYFDKTLVDVPCSMEGRFYTEDLKTFKDWSPKKIKILSGMQKVLLRSAVSCTKPGGTIVYSTCTLSPEENEEIIDWILKKERDCIDIEEILINENFLTPGITKYKQKILDKRISKTKRILPSLTMEGFYIAKIRKLRSNF